MSDSSDATAGPFDVSRAPSSIGTVEEDEPAWTVVPPSAAPVATALKSSFKYGLPLSSPSVEASWSNSARTTSPPSVTSTHASKWIEGDCEILTSDGAVLSVPSYHLQSASPVFREAIAADEGWAQKRVCVDFTTETVEVFLDIVTTGEVVLQWTTAGSAIASVSRLAEFLATYDCEAAANILAKHLKEQAGTTLPPITLLLAGIHLKRPELTKFMFMRHDVPEPQLWSLPNPARQAAMPFVPFEVYLLIPVEYQWALRMMDVHGCENQAPQLGQYQRFCHYLELAQKHRGTLSDCAEEEGGSGTA